MQVNYIISVYIQLTDQTQRDNLYTAIKNAFQSIKATYPSLSSATMQKSEAQVPSPATSESV